MDEWIKKTWCMCMCIYTHKHIYTYNEIVFSLYKEGNSAIWDNTDKPRGHHAKWISQK